MSVWKSLVFGLSLIGGLAICANAEDQSPSCCASATIGEQSCFTCQSSCDTSCYCCCNRRDCCWWKRICLDSTCDMHSHYAYYPEDHGYYYYRPYHWEHYAHDTPRMLGLGVAAPYSEDGFRELKPVHVVELPVLPVRRKTMPSLEELLKP